MRILHFSATAALLAVFVIGCSKHPSQLSSSLPANTKDLGVVEFREGTPQHFTLGDGKGCTVTGKQNSGDIEVDFVIEATNAEDGTVSVLSRPRISTSPGRQCVISVGDVSIGFTPKCKMP
jgi:hypothetical protein